MRRARRMNDQTLRVADVREVRPERDAADEVLPCRPAAAAVEGEDGAGAARQVLVHERSVAARAQTGIGDLGRELVRLEKARDGRGVLDVTGHSERQRLENLEKQECVETAHPRPEVA